MKMFQKKLLSLAVLAAMCLLIFSGCGNTEDGKVTDDRNTSGGSQIGEDISDMGDDIGDMVSDAGDMIEDGVTAAENAGRDAVTDISEAMSGAARAARDAVR